MQPQLISGQRIVVEFDGRNISAGFVMSANILTPHSEEFGVDSTIPFELVPGPVRVRFMLKIYRSVANDPSNMGIAPKADPQYDGRDHQTRYVSIEVRERLTDRTILFLPKCVITARTIESQSEDLVTEVWSVTSIGYKGPEGQRAGILPTIAGALP